ncbi:MAG: error-prone DNA polymerase [Blastocatellia bacterium AA13]|nr:MAG: error-prone DNA polymerase [Blastocatellia bacterium AA13]
MTDYVELHARSAFNFLRGAALPQEMVCVWHDLGGQALALLDRDGIYGAPQAHLAAEKNEITAHIGAEITLSNGTACPVLVRNRAGYQNLCGLITRMKLRSEKGKGAVAFEELAQSAEGLVCLTGGDEGPLAGSLRNGFESGADCVSRLVGIFGKENVYVELQRHCDRAEERRNQAAIEIARKHRLPLLATNEASSAMPCQRELLDVLTCIRNRIGLSDAGRLLAKNSERYLKSASQMTELFSDLPEAIANTLELSSRLEFTLKDLGYRFPDYPVPDGETMASFLRKLTEEGVRSRYNGGSPEAWRQIEHELAVIEKLELPGYFLIVWDIVKFCRNNDILVQGRGSAANSAVCYALGITAVDPVGGELLFERFLSEERGEMPDIDLDLPSGDRRERVIQYLYEKYGMAAAMTAEVITYRSRSAIQEIGKVLGFDEAILKRLSKLSGSWEWVDPFDTARNRFASIGLDPDDHRINKFLSLYCSIQNLPRHLSQHPGGMVIAANSLDSVVPLEPSTMEGRVVLQWDKDDCASLKLIKIDLLGLGMMAVIQDSLTLIEDAYHEKVDLARLPQDDKVYSAIQKADTIGMFQIESRAQMSCLPRIRPEKFYDLVVQVAIIRPGPIQGGMVHPFIRRRQGLESPNCLHPWLESILKRTLGVPLFQEQLLRMAMICADFSGGEAEELRRAMGFKRSEARMREIEVKLRRGMTRKGIVGTTQEKIVQAITAFALYGFPESHAASFALLAYASAYLKCNYLAAFIAATLNNQPMGFYSPLTIVKDAQRHGLKVKPIDIMCSNWLCMVEKENGEKQLRLGMRYVKGLREEAALAIVRERDRAPFSSIDELSLRVPELRKSELRSLAETGALNEIQSSNGERLHRRSALWQVERALRQAGPLFEKIEAEMDCPLDPMTVLERVSSDIELTRVTVGRHPMAHFREELDKIGVTCAADLRWSKKSKVKIAGCVIARQRPGTAKGVLFMSLEDETGLANAVASPSFFDNNRFILLEYPYLLIEGLLQDQEGALTVQARKVSPLPFATPVGESHDFH